jgi:hypothetical protein
MKMHMAVAVGLMVAATPSSAARIFVATVDARGALPESAWRSVQDVTAGAVSRAGHDVITPQQLEAMIGLEATRQLTGCSDEACVTRLHDDLGGALGVDGIVTVTVSNAGSGLVVAVKRVGSGVGGRVADGRVKNKRVDAVLDVLPGLVVEVLTGLPSSTSPSTKPTTPTTPTTPTAPTTATATKTPWLVPGLTPRTPPTVRAKKPLTLDGATKKKLAVFEDDSGRVVAFPAEQPLDGPVFAGRLNDGVYAQRVIGGSTEGGTTKDDLKFELYFWDPRFDGAQGRSLILTEGVLSAVCGPTTRRYRPASKATAAKALAQVHDVAWQRRVVALARDDDLNWYVLDDSTDDRADFVVWAGRKIDGAYRFSPVEGEAVNDTTYGDGGVLLVAPGLKLKIGPFGGEVLRGTDRTALTSQDLAVAAVDVYGAMQPWGHDLSLGTVCD